MQNVLTVAVDEQLMLVAYFLIALQTRYNDQIQRNEAMQYFVTQLCLA